MVIVKVVKKFSDLLQPTKNGGDSQFIPYICCFLCVNTQILGFNIYNIN